MKALIFAAGRGKRMMPLTLEKPKPLLEVLGKPLLVHIMNALPKEIDEIILVIGYKGEMIREYFGEEFQGRSIKYVEQKEPLGTGDALVLCQKFVADSDLFLVIYADDFHDSEVLGAAVQAARPSIFVAKVEYPERFGIVVTDADGRVLSLEEAPKEPRTNLGVTGAYLLGPGIFAHKPNLESNGEYYINSMLIPYMSETEVFARQENFWIPIGYPEDLKKAETILRSRQNER